MAAALCRLGYHDLRSTRGANVNKRAMSPPHRMNLRLLGCNRDETATYQSVVTWAIWRLSVQSRRR